MSQAGSGRFRVLVVDDDALYAAFVRDLFLSHCDGPAEFAVEVADCGSRARELLKDGGWSLVLIDQYLGDGKGMDLIRELLERDCGMPLAMMSGEADLQLEQDDMACFVEGRVHYFQKSELNWKKVSEALQGVLPQVYRVLIVDDDEDDLYYEASCIESKGLIRFNVDQAENMEQAAALLKASSYDVVLLDYRMNGARGTDLLPTIRKLSPEAKVVLCTHFTGSNVIDERAVTEIANGALFYMDKLNINPDSLMSELSLQLGI